MHIPLFQKVLGDLGKLQKEPSKPPKNHILQGFLSVPAIFSVASVPSVLLIDFRKVLKTQHLQNQARKVAISNHLHSCVMKKQLSSKF